MAKMSNVSARSSKARESSRRSKQALFRRRNQLAAEYSRGISPALVARLQYRRKVAEVAYFLAERRGFAPGSELEDWLEAESVVRADGWAGRLRGTV